MLTTFTYKAVLIQSGANAPTAAVLQNTFVDEIVWTRVSPGNYRGTLANGWRKGRTMIICYATNDGTGNTPGACIINDSEINLYLNNEDTVNTFNLIVEYSKVCEE